MISYLIYSTICLGLVLLFYHAFLAKEKIYQINRFYLLIGLLFSLTIPIMPVGVADSFLDLGSNPELPILQLISNGFENAGAESISEIPANSTKSYEKTTTNFKWIYPLLLCLYGTISLFLFVRMIRHLYRMQLKTLKNPATFFKGHKIVLVDEEVIPHTFWETIFVNQEQYENGKIGEEVLIHELTHARQNHSLDILIIEILKTIFWFNPILYFYKTAIQLNHEFIADDRVLSGGADIADYQALLLRIRTVKPARYLSTSLNFKITKKRFKMMTQNSSTCRSSLKAAAIIPFFLILGITFGCEPTSLEENYQTQNITLELVDSETIKLNGESLSTSEFKSQFFDLSIDPEKTLINFKVHKNIPMGLVTDVQKILRERGTLRVNYSTVQSKDSQAEEIQNTSLHKRNILQIYITEGGDLIVNENQASLSSIKKLVREFITNDGENNRLSESPKDAIIAIRSDKRTPYDTYTSALDKVFAVYDELRNQASMEVFDKPFHSLEAGSEERNQIENIYPRKISIAEPSNS